MLFKLLINLFLISSYLNASEIDLLFLEKQERSIKKDFFILKFLEQENTSPNDAIKALGMSKEVKNKLFFAYAKRLKHDETLGVVQCMQSDISFLINSYADCIMAGLSIKEASSLNVLQLDTIISKIENKYKDFSSILKIINSPLPFSKLISSKKEIIYQVYLNASDDFLINKLNYKLPKSTIRRIKEDSRFPSLFKRIIKNEKMTLAQKSFFALETKDFNFDTSFYLVLNLLKHDKKEESLKLLNSLSLDLVNIKDKNKILYLNYLIKKDKNYLKEIVNNNILDLYTLSSYEILKKTLNKNFFKDYFNPYENELKKYSREKAVLFLSLMKERSNFDINIVKDEYSIGVAQINIETFNKIKTQIKTKDNINTLFTVKGALFYLNNDLENSYSDTKDKKILTLLSYLKDINKDDFTKSLSSFFINLELLGSHEECESIKNILVNFFIYNNLLLHENVQMQTLFKK